MSDLRKKAINISGIVASVDAGDRGVLFKLVADELDKHGQWYTAILFEEIAEKYGMPK